MSHAIRLQLVLMGSLTAARAMYTANQKLPDALSYCLHKGQVQRLWEEHSSTMSLEPWQRSTLQTLPEELQPTGLSAAALCWCGEGGTPRSGTWMHVEPVHFAAGMNDIRIVLLNDITDTQMQQFMSALQPLLSLSGFELHRSLAGRWYVWCEAVLDVQTHFIHDGIAVNDYDMLPSGHDASRLRRLLTEIQMLLHQHPLNEQREASGLLPFNAVWLSGAGSLVTATSSTRQRIMSDQPYVQGLCSQLNISCWPIPFSAQELLQLKDDDMVLVINGVDLEQLDEQWLQPLLKAVNAGNITLLNIHLDHLKFTLQGGRWRQLRRWFAPGNIVAELLN